MVSDNVHTGPRISKNPTGIMKFAAKVTFPYHFRAFVAHVGSCPCPRTRTASVVHFTNCVLDMGMAQPEANFVADSARPKD